LDRPWILETLAVLARFVQWHQLMMAMPPKLQLGPNGQVIQQFTT
jgi:hypothetical protein